MGQMPSARSVAILPSNRHATGTVQQKRQGKKERLEKAMLRRVPMFRLPPVIGSALLVGALSVSGVHSVAAQGRDPKIWDGVYSAAQAERGKANFEAVCARCHNPQLTGSDRGPALKGENFWSHWENESVGALFMKVRDQMPPNLTASQLEPEVKLDIVTYILHANGLPSGVADLKIDADVLEDIQIVQKGADATMPNFALVQVVGCLTQDPTKTWMLTNTSQPVRTRDHGSMPDGLKNAEANPLGQETYRLISINRFQPDSYRGHKVEAKGLLYKAPDKNLLDLISLQAVAPSCAN
jgi:cytochrome c553